MSVIREVRRNVRWARQWGWRYVVEEHDLDPVDRVPRAVRHWRWRLSHRGARVAATPAFLVGAQRSGTNMLVRLLAASPEVEVHNEGDRRAFDNFRLRPLPAVREIVESSRYPLVLFKPICDTHRVDEMLDTLGATQPGRAIWAYRDVDGRVRSELAHFGDSNLRVLRAFVAGTAGDAWQVQRLSERSVGLIRSFDFATMNAASAAALFWYVRNQQFFELHLDARDDVILVSYNRFLRNPSASMQALCEFLGCHFEERFVARVGARRAAWHEPLDIEPRVRMLCEELGTRLDEHADRLAGRNASIVERRRMP